MIGIRDDAGAPAPPSHAPTLAAKIFAEGGWLERGLQRAMNDFNGVVDLEDETQHE